MNYKRVQRLQFQNKSAVIVREIESFYRGHKSGLKYLKLNPLNRLPNAPPDRHSVVRHLA
jgi:hypothetical protein